MTGRHAKGVNHKWRAAVAAAGLLVTSAAVVLAGAAPTNASVPVAQTSTADSASSAVTKQGTGVFQDLRVTVGQTTSLTNQVVRVSWTGGDRTEPATEFAYNYLQMMQCWSEPGAVEPTREQCQFGANADPRGGTNTASRQLNQGGIVDPEEEIQPPIGGAQYLTFKTAKGEEFNGENTDNPFFDRFSTNELPYARTSPDGSGEALFEVQTGLEAPGLACGQVLEGQQAPKPCWLVVVPRGDREVNGELAGTSQPERLKT